jgi:hypothetical protein
MTFVIGKYSHCVSCACDHVIYLHHVPCNLHVLCAMYYVLCTMYYVPCTMQYVPMYSVLCIILGVHNLDCDNLDFTIKLAVVTVTMCHIIYEDSKTFVAEN